MAVFELLIALLLQSTGSRFAGSVAVVRGLSCPEAWESCFRPGIEPVSPVLAGGLLAGPPGKS